MQKGFDFVTKRTGERHYGEVLRTFGGSPRAHLENLKINI